MRNLKLISKKAVLLSALTGIYIICSAHFIWTETPGLATIGKEHLVNLFFGEVNIDQREVKGGRLDEMDGLKSIYINPKNEKKKLQLVKQKDRFTTKFIPKEKGIYQILTTNEVAKVMDLRKYHLGIVKPMYYSRQIVLCPDKSNPYILKDATIKPYFDLDLIPKFNNSKLNTFSVKQPVNFYSYFNKQAIKGGEISIYGPNGWSKEIEADDKGLCTFTPLSEGQYVVDWVYTETSPGTFQDKHFEFIRHRAVLTINVAK